MEFLSEIELYYSPNVIGEKVKIIGEEVRHISKVMRHKPGDKLYTTDGKGFLYEGTIEKISKDEIEINIISKKYFENVLENIWFCLPKIKSQDRIEFAIEKCTELGITNFIFYNAEREIKSNLKRTRIEKVAMSAMKQSLRLHLPKIEEVNSITDLNKFNHNLIVLEQKSPSRLSDLKIISGSQFYFLFGPEGGFSEKETSLICSENHYSLGLSRLRTETAAVSCASIIQMLI
ncbi:MAG: 16S rRNA (uracil(1498)-N(3))-methyltransferase [Ignavibacteriales bacterium]|nr:MAG: 16S rRNA (uracil(1498)-N(3))-methyltransferase [Ignavibacteriales bacterium]